MNKLKMNLKVNRKKLLIYWWIIALIVLVFFITFYDDYDGDFKRRKMMHRDLRFEEKMNVVISSAYWDNKWFIINDSLAFDARSVRNDSVRLGDYLASGDVLIKRE